MLTKQEHNVLHRARRDGEVSLIWDSTADLAAQGLVKRNLLVVNEQKSRRSVWIGCNVYEPVKENEQ